MQGQGSNLRPSGYGPDELPPAPPCNIEEQLPLLRLLDPIQYSNFRAHVGISIQSEIYFWSIINRLT